MPVRIMRTALFACTAIIALPARSDEASRIRTFEAALRPAVSVVGQPEERWTIAERMAHWKVPGLSITVIRDGKLAWAKGYGVLQAGGSEKVNAETVFSIGSVSKVGAAAVTLRLLDAGRLDLDRDVNGYLKRWKIPANGYTAVRPVTLRALLSHSAGLTVHGFSDFQPGDPLPSAIDTLEGRAPATNEPVRVIFTPGTRYQYSGGGTTVEQVVIEEITGLGFAAAAHRYVLEPLGMSRSTYENPLPEAQGNIAKAHDEQGRPVALPRGYEAMPEMAASGLWTTPTDYAKLIVALIESYRGKGSFLRTDTARQMMTEAACSPVGLGPFLDGDGLERSLLPFGRERFIPRHDGGSSGYRRRRGDFHQQRQG